jgi:DNA-binding transcriptional MocR family regulator
VMVSESRSQCHGAPGLRIGWLICRDESLRRRFGAAKMGTVVACGTIDEALAALILEREAEVVGRHRSALAQGLDILATWALASRSWIEWVRPDAGALCSLRFRAQVGDEVVARARRGFTARGVKVAPGPMFGDDPRTFRIGFGGLPPAALREGLDAMSEALAEATGAA